MTFIQRVCPFQFLATGPFFIHLISHWPHKPTWRRHYLTTRTILNVVTIKNLASTYMYYFGIMFKFAVYCNALFSCYYTCRLQVSSRIALPFVQSRAGYYMYSHSFLAAERWNSLPASRRSMLPVSSFTSFSQQLRLLLGFPRRLSSVE